MATGLSIARSAHAAGSDLIRIALIGCGGRGTGAAINALSTKANVKLVAMADAFQDYLDNSLRGIQSQRRQGQGRRAQGAAVRRPGRLPEGDRGRRGHGAPVRPARLPPRQFEAAVKAGKHVFMEKPVATDAPGIRRIMAANDEAKKKGLVVAVGHHLRHEVKHKEAIKRIHDGAIGEIIFLRIYFNSSGVWMRPREPGQTEMQHQVRNWYYFTWLSGDHIVEQHVHDIDVANWMMKDQHPVAGQRHGRAPGPHRQGLRRDLRPPLRRVRLRRRHQAASASAATSPAAGRASPSTPTAPRATPTSRATADAVLYVDGQQPMKWERGARRAPGSRWTTCSPPWPPASPTTRATTAPSASMTAILGRMATYSGKVVTWDDAINSTLDLAPEQWTWDAKTKTVPGPDGIYPALSPA